MQEAQAHSTLSAAAHLTPRCLYYTQPATTHNCCLHQASQHASIYGAYPIVASPPVFVCCEMLTRALCARVTACIDADCPAGEAAELVFRQANSRDLKKAFRGIHGSHQPACGRAKVSCSPNSNSKRRTAASAATHEGTDTVCTVNSAAAVASWRPE